MSSSNRGGATIGLVVLVLVVGLVIGFAGSFHTVVTRDGIRTYPKARFTLSEAYVDMTKTSFVGLRRYPSTVRAMTTAGDLELMPGGTTLKAAAEAGQQVLQAIDRFDSEGEIRSNLIDVADQAAQLGETATERYRELDAQYDISGKARDAAAGAADLTAKGLGGLNRLLGGKR